MSETTTETPVTDVNDEQSVDAPESDVQDVEFYNVHQLTRTAPGIYLDDDERRHAEENRARLEGREPDYENLPSTAGTPLTTEAGAKAVLGLPGDANVSLNAETYQTLPVDVTGSAAPTATSPVPAPEGTDGVEPTPDGTATTYVVDGGQDDGEQNAAPGENTSLNAEQLNPQNDHENE